MAITLNTNSAAFIALANLRTVQDALQASEKKISTGYTVSDALDNGAVFGVAQSVRGSIAGNTAVSQELGNFSGLVTVAAAAATQISNNLSDIRSTLSHLSTAALDGVSRQQYTVQLKSLVDSVNNFIKGAQYGETNLLNTTQNFDILADHQNGNVLKVIGGNYSLNLAYTDLTNAANGPTFTTAQTTALTTARGSLVTALSTASGAVTGAANTAAATGAIATLSTAVGTFNTALTNNGFSAAEANNITNGIQTALTGALAVASAAIPAVLTAAALAAANASISTAVNDVLARYDAALVTPSAVQAQNYQNNTFAKVSNTVSTVLNTIGALNRSLNTQLNFNANVRSALNNALGALIDADLAAESANLTALQVKQSLSTQALSIANQGPNTLLRLFQ